MDLSYFSDFLANLFNIPHEDYEVVKDSSYGFTAEYDRTTTEETMEDIEAEVAVMLSEISENCQSKGAVERKRIEPLEVRAHKSQDVLQAECHDYLKEMQSNSNRISWVKGNKDGKKYDDDEEKKTDSTEDFNNNVGDEIAMGDHGFVTKLCCVRIRKLNLNGGEAQTLHLANSSPSVDKHESDDGRGISSIYGNKEGERYDEGNKTKFNEDFNNNVGDEIAMDVHGFVNKLCCVRIRKLNLKRMPLYVYETVDAALETREESKYTGLDEIVATNTTVDEGLAKPQEHCGNASSMKCPADDIQSEANSVDYTNSVIDENQLMIDGSQPRIKNQSSVSDPRNDILVLDEVYEVGCGTNRLFDETDLNYFNLISKRDSSTVTNVKTEVEGCTLVDKDPCSLSQKPMNSLKQKVKNVMKTVAKKFCVSKKKNRVIPLPSPRIKSAFSSSSPNLKSKDNMIKRKVMKGMKDGKVSEVITGNVLDNNSLYSDITLADFFNPHQPKNEIVKKEEFDSSGLARSFLHGVGGTERLSSFKIPKLPVAPPLTREAGINDLEVFTNNVKGNQDVSSKGAFTDQMVMVNDEWIKLGDYLKMEGIFPKVDMMKCMSTQHNSSEYESAKVETKRRLLPLDKDELDDIYHENWEEMREISTDKERKDLSSKVFRNPVPANPSNNLTYHGYRRRGKYYEHNGQHSRYRYIRASHPVGSVAIRLGVLDPLPGYKRKYSDIDATSKGCKRSKIEYEYFKQSMKSLYYEKCKNEVRCEKLSRRQFEDFKFFMEHVKDGQEETQNFLSFYCKKAVVLDEVQVDEVIDMESIFSRFKLFYGDPDPAKCERCGNTYHLFSQ